MTDKITPPDMTPFMEALGEHPGRKMFEEYIGAFTKLDDLERAEHIIAQSDTYKNYLLAQKYGIQIYNYTQGEL
jgi:hypothetical protein